MTADEMIYRDPLLDLACGKTCAEGYAGVDRIILPGVAWVTDLTEFPWVLVSSTRPVRWYVGDGTIEGLRASHFLEHVVDLVGFMNEAWRVLAPGAEFEIIVPYQFSAGAWQDPTHVRAFNEKSWWYYDAKARAENGLAHYPLVCDFEVVDVKPWTVDPDLPNLTPAEQIHALKHEVNWIYELRALLRKR